MPAWAGLVTPCFPGEANEKFSLVPAFDIFISRYEALGTLDFDDGAGELDTSRSSVFSFLHAPHNFDNGWSFLSAADYTLTTLDFENTPPGFGDDDESLHKFSLHGGLYHTSPGDRWVYGGWARASFSSDTRQVDSDDFFFDVAIGGAYAFSERLIVGLGVAGLELGSDPQVLPGPLLYWRPHEAFNLNWGGPLFNATWRPQDHWALAFRVRPYGNSWNIEDNNGESRQLDLASYTASLEAEYEIYHNLWLTAGIGFSFGNNLEWRDSGNDPLFDTDLDQGISYSIGLRVRTW
jgi:hypothetical protein